jgi:hypothetical protein
MQYHGSARDRAHREAERKDLQTLVGTNLVNVANLDGVDDKLCGGGGKGGEGERREGGCVCVVMFWWWWW